MANANSPTPNTKKRSSELNEQFYTLLKELVETQTTILEKVVAIEDALGKAGTIAKDPLQAWKDM